MDSTLLDISLSLSSEKNTKAMLELILIAAKTESRADGGTIYSLKNENEIAFDTLINDSLGLHIGGTSNNPITYPNIPIYINGEVNKTTIVSYSAGTGEVINISNMKQLSDYQLSLVKCIDKNQSYNAQSVLTVPMKNHEGDLIGVLQLVNALDNGKVIPFSQDAQRRVLALASLASVALTNRQLIDSMEELFQSFTKLIAKAIDEKSPYTGGHCRRLPELTMMLAEAVHRYDSGPMAQFKMTEDDRYELNLASWIHDCGKIATPEYVMDKSKKLETIHDRIHLVECRFELVKRDLEIAYWKSVSQGGDNIDEFEEMSNLLSNLKKLDEDLLFIKKANTGGEFMPEPEQERVGKIGNSHYVDINGLSSPLLTDDEIYNLKISKGTLNKEERKIIDKHMDITIEMLESLPFPKHLKRVPEYAGGHHEKMDGTGYPKGLTREEMSIPARIMGIADIFEALTATDRPYKEPKKISECLTIMEKMKDTNHIDPDLYDIFVEESVFLEYAQKFLKEEQIDVGCASSTVFV